MAGDRPGYEEALRSLYAKNRDDFERRIKLLDARDGPSLNF